MSDREQARVQRLLHRLSEVEEHATDLSREIERSNRLITLGTIAAGVAHEINNILTPALAYVQLAESNPDDAELQAKARKRIRVSLEAAARVIHAILGFAADSDEPRQADIARALQASLDCLARDPSKDGIQLITQIDAPFRVRIQPIALQQVLMNLIINACTAMRHKGGELRITAGHHANHMVRIEVADTGPGIPDDVIGSVFQPFVSYRADAIGTSRDNDRLVGGSGLGLAVSRKLIEEAGGTITVDSSPGQGATFIITLPIAQAEHARAG